VNYLKNRFSGRTGIALLIILSMALGASLAVNLGGRNAAYAVDEKTNVQQQRAPLYDLQNAFTSIVDEVLPSVVTIASTRTREANSSDEGDSNDMFKGLPFPFPGQPGQPDGQPEKSSGSGVIVRADGYILTNDHVVSGADKVTVTLKDGREFEGKVSRDTKSDLALIKIEAKNLPAAKLGDSSKVKVGSWAIAMGSPFGLDQTVTVGVISGTGRQEAASDGQDQKFYPNLLQTDASINPGNSGGPLVNIAGEVIGINTLIRSSFGGGSIGIGFAIPINTAKRVETELIEHGKVIRGYMGLVPASLTPKTAERYGVKDGAAVMSVEVGTPADKAGLQVEDVIVQFDGKKIASDIELREAISATAPGKEVNIVVVRDKEQKTLKATVGEVPGADISEAPKESTTKLGFSVASITPDLATKYKLDENTKGIIITRVTPRSSAMQEGIQPGLMVVGVNGKPVQTVAEFNAATKGLKSGDTLRLRVKTKQRTAVVEFTID
jgi:serine protease Do